MWTRRVEKQVEEQVRIARPLGRKERMKEMIKERTGGKATRKMEERGRTQAGKDTRAKIGQKAWKRDIKKEGGQKERKEGMKKRWKEGKKDGRGRKQK